MKNDCSASNYRTIDIKYVLVDHGNEHGVYYQLPQLIISLYQYLIKNFNRLPETKVSIYYNNVYIDELKLTYQKNLVLYNDNNYISAPVICPEAYVLDVILGSKIPRSQKNSQDRRISRLPEKQGKQEREEGKNMLTRIKRKFNGQEEVKEQIEELPRTDREPDEQEMIYKKLMFFKNDKKAYFEIRNDIERGTLKWDDINPYFLLKYQIFRILEFRGAIKLGNDNIEQEYQEFTQLHDVCQENNYECLSTETVYIPHNYQYLSDYEKEEYAAKYHLTRQELEDRYINNIDSEDTNAEII